MTATPWPCPDCHQTHPRGCHGHVKLYDANGNRTGQRPCRLSPIRGLDVCRKHGAGSPQAKAKSERVQAEQAAAREVARLGVKLDIHPAVALVDLVQWTAGEVAYWRDVVTALAEDGHEALTWGVVKTEKGRDRGERTKLTTEQAGQHIAYSMLEKASDRLASYAAAALRAGVDERRVRLAEQQGALVADVIRGVITALVQAILTSLRAAGIRDVDVVCEVVERAVAEAVPTIVPQQLRLLTHRKDDQS